QGGDHPPGGHGPRQQGDRAPAVDQRAHRGGAPGADPEPLRVPQPRPDDRLGGRQGPGPRGGPGGMSVPARWRALLIVYRRIAVREPVPFAHSLSHGEVADGVDAFQRFPALAARLSGGEAVVDVARADAARALDSLTPMGDGIAWPSPSDTRAELDELAPPGAYDSVFVLWPQRDL